MSCVRDKENPSLVFSWDREIPTRGSTVPVGNEASTVITYLIKNKNTNLLYIWRGTVVYLWRRTVKYVTLEVTSDVLKRF